MPCCVDDDDALLCGEDADELERDGESGPSSSRAADGGGHGEVVLVTGERCFYDVAVAEFVLGLAARSPRSAVHRPGWSGSVAWILKVQSYHGFQPATAYLAVSYMDRFLSSRSLPDHEWASQLLCVACLSLAAKMEETSAPPLLDLQQIEGTRFVFEPRTIQRMELLVLVELDWRLRSLTPFAFVEFFACKAGCYSGRCATILASRACQITLNAIHEIEFLNHCTASMAAAAVLLAVNEAPAAMSCTGGGVSSETAASWCIGLTEVGRDQQLLSTACTAADTKDMLVSKFIFPEQKAQA
ncbi:hypothetical protein ABZP36_011564 [Zizania latifolia]